MIVEDICTEEVDTTKRPTNESCSSEVRIAKTDILEGRVIKSDIRKIRTFDRAMLKMYPAKCRSREITIPHPDVLPCYRVNIRICHPHIMECCILAPSTGHAHTRQIGTRDRARLEYTSREIGIDDTSSVE